MSVLPPPPGVASGSQGDVDPAHTFQSSIPQPDLQHVAPQVCPHCGLSGHSRRSSRHCLKRKELGGNQTNSCSRASSSQQWEFIKEAEEYELVPQMELVDAFFSQNFREHLIEVIKQGRKRANALDSSDSEENAEDVDDCSISRIQAIEVLGDQIFKTMYPWCKQQMTIKKKELQRTDSSKYKKLLKWEFWSWLGLYIGTGLIDLPLGDCIQMLQGSFGQRYPHVTDNSVFLSVSRFLEITECMRTTDPCSKTMNATDSVNNWREFEKKMFCRSKDIFVTKWSTLVIDDELVKCRASGVQSKALSNRKAGKEGQKNDAVADSLLRTIVGLRHKERLGYSQSRTVEELLKETLSDLSVSSNTSIIVALDRGYASTSMFRMLAKCDVGFISICKSGVNNGHAFKLLSSTKNADAVNTTGDGNTIVNASQQTPLRSNTPSSIINSSQEIQHYATDDTDDEEHSDTNADIGQDQQSDDSHNFDNEEFHQQLQNFQSRASENLQASAHEGIETVNSRQDPGAPFHDVDFAHEYEQNIIVDHPDLGVQIRVATTQLHSSRPTSANQVTMYSVAFREYNKKDNSQSSVYRMVISLPAQDMDRIAKQICIIPKSMSRATTMRTLFHPHVSYNYGQKELMENVMNKIMENAIPLTLAQRTADWFILRRFIVTGTMGDYLARHHPSARSMLLKSPGQCPVTSLAEVANKLRNSWVFKRGLATTDMKSGTLNEDRVIKSLCRNDQHPYVKTVFECGLFQSKHAQVMGVSPDGVAVITYPLDAGKVDCIASVEIKTRLSPNKISNAVTVRNKYGAFFECNVGSEVWWDVIPEENRSQVLQQSTTLGLPVLFVTATVQGIVYCCLVHMTSDQRNDFRDSITKWESLMLWAHNSIRTSGPPPNPPQAFTRDDAFVLFSHVRLWRALRKRIYDNKVPELPVFKFKSAVQVLYNKTKGGLDGNTKYVSSISGQVKSEFSLKLETNVALRTIKHMLINSFLLHRCSKAYDYIKDNDEFSLSAFRSYVNKKAFEPLNKFALETGLELVAKALEMKHTRAHNANIPPSTGEAFFADVAAVTQTVKEYRENKKRSASYLKLFNSTEGKRVRLSPYVKHLPVSLKMTCQKGQMRCTLCSTKTSWQCSICQVALHFHSKGSDGRSRTCWDQFHSNLEIRHRQKSNTRHESGESAADVGTNSDS